MTARLSGLLEKLVPSTDYLTCLYHQARFDSASPDSFVVLISHLDNDPSGAVTRRVVSAFRGQPGFDYVPQCDSVEIRSYGAQSEAEEVAIKSGRERLKRKGGDLLIWGEVLDPIRQSVHLWFVNEAGECDTAPRSYSFAGEGAERFEEQFATALTQQALKTISSACTGTKYRDVSRLRAIAKKMQMLIDNPGPLYKSGVPAQNLNYFFAESNMVLFAATKEQSAADLALKHYDAAFAIANTTSDRAGWAQSREASIWVRWQLALEKSSTADIADVLKDFRLYVEKAPLENDVLYDASQWNRCLTSYASIWLDARRMDVDVTALLDNRRTFESVLEKSGLTPETTADLDYASAILLQLSPPVGDNTSNLRHAVSLFRDAIKVYAEQGEVGAAVFRRSYARTQVGSMSLTIADLESDESAAADAASALEMFLTENRQKNGEILDCKWCLASYAYAVVLSADHRTTDALIKAVDVLKADEAANHETLSELANSKDSLGVGLVALGKRTGDRGLIAQGNSLIRDGLTQQTVKTSRAIMKRHLLLAQSALRGLSG